MCYDISNTYAVSCKVIFSLIRSTDENSNRTNEIKKGQKTNQPFYNPLPPPEFSLDFHREYELQAKNTAIIKNISTPFAPVLMNDCKMLLDVCK